MQVFLGTFLPDIIYERLELGDEIFWNTDIQSVHVNYSQESQKSPVKITNMIRLTVSTERCDLQWRIFLNLMILSSAKMSDV